MQPWEDAALLEAAWRCWEGGMPRVAGGLLFDSLPPDRRPAWAADLLEIAIHRSRRTLRCVHATLRIARDPARWSEGRAAFDVVQGRLFAALDVYHATGGRKRELQMLGTAGLAAQVAYNASAPSDPFEGEPGWSLAECMRGYVDAADDPPFACRIWAALSNRSP